MGYVPELMAVHGKPAPVLPEGPPPLNLDRHGMPRDYATYVWLLYGKRVEDKSPARRAFLNASRFPQMVGAHFRHQLSALYDPALMDTEIR